MNAPDSLADLQALRESLLQSLGAVEITTRLLAEYKARQASAMMPAIETPALARLNTRHVVDGGEQRLPIKDRIGSSKRHIQQRPAEISPKAPKAEAPEALTMNERVVAALQKGPKSSRELFEYILPARPTTSIEVIYTTLHGLKINGVVETFADDEHDGQNRYRLK